MRDVENTLFLGDSHGNGPFVVKAIAEGFRANCQAVVQVGDFGVWDHIQVGVHFLNRVEYALEMADMILVFVDGNHENFNSLYNYPVDSDGFRRLRSRIWHAPRGHVWEWDGVRFLAMGGAHSIDGPGGPEWWKQRYGQARGPLDEAVWDRAGVEEIAPAGFDLGGWWPQEMITEEDVRGALSAIEKYGPIDIMVSHDAPYEVDVPGIKGYPKANMNRQLLSRVVDAAQPQRLFCGHYHRRYTGQYNHTVVEVLAADVNQTDQALAVSLEQFRSI